MAIDYVLHWSDDSLKEPFKLKTQSTNKTKTSLTLSGRGALNWAENIQSNMLRMLETFASNDLPPENPTIGQLWFNTKTNYLRIWWQGKWNDVGYNRIDGPVPPTGPYFAGDLWYDTIADKLKVYDNNGTWDAVYQGGIPVPAPLPTPTPVAPTPTPSTPTAPSPLPPGTPTPVPTAPTPIPVSPTPTPASPTPASPTPASPTPVTPTPVPTVPTPVTPTPSPTVPAPTVPVPNPIPPTISVTTPQYIDNGTFQVGIMYNGATGTGELDDTLPYSIVVTDIGTQQSVVHYTGVIRRINGYSVINNVPKPDHQTTFAISGNINNVPAQSKNVSFQFQTAPAPTTTPKGNPAPQGQNGSQYELIWNDEFDNQYALNWTNAMWYEQPSPTINYTVEQSLLKIWPAYNAQGKLFNRDLTTDGIRYAQYGFIEFRASLPRGKGLMPSIWMYNKDVAAGTAGPEIDLMNVFCSGGIDAGWSDASNVPTAFESVVATPTGNNVVGSFQKSSLNIGTGFHTYGVKWIPGNMKFYFDGQLYYDLNVTFEAQVFFIISLRIGAPTSLGGAPDTSTPTGLNNLGTFQIDYVRHWTIL